MENNKPNMEQRLQAAMDSLDGASRAQANPFLYTRIQQQLANRNNGWERVATFLTKPAFAVAVVVACISANVWAATRNHEERMAVVEQTPEQLFAAEYATADLILTEPVADK